MCRKAEETTLKMVTPTKVKHHNHQNQRGSHRGGGKGWTPPPNKQRGTTSSPVGNGNNTCITLHQNMRSECNDLCFITQPNKLTLPSPHPPKATRAPNSTATSPHPLHWGVRHALPWVSAMSPQPQTACPNHPPAGTLLQLLSCHPQGSSYSLTILTTVPLNWELPTNTSRCSSTFRHRVVVAVNPENKTHFGNEPCFITSIQHTLNIF